MDLYYSQLFVRLPYPSKSFEGQTVIVTGSNVGLGFEAACHFARLGASAIILAVRNVAAGNEAKVKIERLTSRPGSCQVWDLDLASSKSIQAFAERAKNLDRLDVVVANASMANPETFAVLEGHERHIIVNVIGTFLLILLLLEPLTQTARSFGTSQPRLTVVTSEMHKHSAFPERNAAAVFPALDDEMSTNMNERYCTSKLLQVLLVRELSSRISDTGVMLNMVNPGLCHSSLARDYGWGFWLFKALVARSTEVGSRALLGGASAGPESHGRYKSDLGPLNRFVSDVPPWSTLVWSLCGAIRSEVSDLSVHNIIIYYDAASIGISTNLKKLRAQLGFSPDRYKRKAASGVRRHFICRGTHGSFGFHTYLGVWQRVDPRTQYTTGPSLFKRKSTARSYTSIQADTLCCHSAQFCCVRP